MQFLSSGAKQNGTSAKEVPDSLILLEIPVDFFPDFLKNGETECKCYNKH